jgi:hypothetical protein
MEPAGIEPATSCLQAANNTVPMSPGRLRRREISGSRRTCGLAGLARSHQTFGHWCPSAWTDGWLSQEVAASSRLLPAEASYSRESSKPTSIERGAIAWPGPSGVTSGFSIEAS